MKKIRFGFAFKITVFVSLITFVVIFVVNYLVLDYFYGLVRNYTENMLKVINKGLKDDFFLWMVEEIKNYGDEIVENNYDEYEFYGDTVKGNITALARSYDITSGVKPKFLKEYEEQYKEQKIEDLFVSSFYWDGSRIHSLDHKYDDEEFIEYLKSSKLEVGQTDFFISRDKSKLIYIYKLKKGILGGSASPEKYNEVWIRNVFRGIKLNFYVSYDQKSDNNTPSLRFSRIISDVPQTRDVESIYKLLSPKLKGNQELEVVGDVVFDTIFFLVYHDYEGVIFKGILEIPVRGVSPFSVLEMSIVSSGPIMVFVLLIMFVINNRIFIRIKELSEKMSELGKSGGDLSYRIEARTNISEVREVAENINDFLDAVEGIVKKSKDTFRDVEQNIQVLSELGDEVVKVGEVISKQDEVRQMIEEINAMTGEVGTTVEEMLRSIETIRNNIEKQYAMVEEMSGMIEETIMTVSNVGKRIERANELLSNLRDEALRSSGSVRKNVEEVRDVNMFLGNVLEVVDVIKGISDRIEVLSMNAGIEAAHAGEAGRGFAVVAEEMGNLAEDSRKKAVEVERIVRDVIERVKGSVEGVEENGERFVRIADGIREVSAFVGEINASMVEVGRTNEMVMGVISNLTSYSEGIKVAIEEGRVGMEEVVRAVYEVSDATGELSDRFGEVYGVMRDTIEVLRGASEKLPLVVESLRVLGEELNKFKVKEIKFSKGITLVE